MTGLRILGAGALLLASGFAYAGPCTVSIESDDRMQYSTHELAVPADCTDVEVTLKHSGKLPPAELHLLDIQKARGIPYPDDIFAWREANADAIAALEPQIQAEAGQ